MSEGGVGANLPPDETFLLAQVNVLLRWRRFIGIACVLGGLVGLTAGLLRRHLFLSQAIFLPQTSDASLNASGLALAASQFGFRLPVSSGSWGPPVYVALLSQRSLLAPIAADTFVVAEEGNRKATFMDLYEVKAPRPDVRLDKAVVTLRSLLEVREDKALGAVIVNVMTPWPSVSQVIAQQLVAGVQRFNQETRKSQATAERQFAEARADEAERALRDAEDRLQSFLERNRSTEAPQLSLDRGRLEREVTMRQTLYTSLLQAREEARLREVRDTPVITIIEEPRLPVIPESRRTILKAALGVLGFGILSVVLAFLSEGLAGARASENVEAQEFYRLSGELKPRFLRRRGA